MASIRTRAHADRIAKIRDIEAGLLPEREVDIPGHDGMTAVTLYLWFDGAVTWKDHKGDPRG